MAVWVLGNPNYHQNHRTGIQLGMASQRNENIQARREARQGKNNSKPLKSGSINMSMLGGNQDTILFRKQLAKKRAMKVISDAWAGDQKIDMGIAERKAHIQELQSDIERNRKVVEDGNAMKAELKETYGIDDHDMEQQKDLELLKKKHQAETGSFVSFTEEEQARLKELENTPLAEYQKRVSEIDDAIDYHTKEMEKAQNEVNSENAAIRGVRLERLKRHDMVDAQKTADKINEAASKEVIGMLVGEAKEIMDEIRKEEQEAAKKKAEEKEEQEEKIEEKREEREELQEQLELKREENAEVEEAKERARENAREQADLLEAAEEYMVDPTTNTSQIKAEIKNMLHKMKLLEEDIKGAKVDDVV